MKYKLAFILLSTLIIVACTSKPVSKKLINSGDIIAFSEDMAVSYSAYMDKFIVGVLNNSTNSSDAGRIFTTSFVVSEGLKRIVTGFKTYCNSHKGTFDNEKKQNLSLNYLTCENSSTNDFLTYIYQYPMKTGPGKWITGYRVVVGELPLNRNSKYQMIVEMKKVLNETASKEMNREASNNIIFSRGTFIQ